MGEHSEFEASPATPCGFSAPSDPKRRIPVAHTRWEALLTRTACGKVRHDRTKDMKKREGGTDKDNDNGHCRNQYTDCNDLKHVCNIGSAPSNNIPRPWRNITKSILKFYSNIYMNHFYKCLLRDGRPLNIRSTLRLQRDGDKEEQGGEV